MYVTLTVLFFFLVASIVCVNNNLKRTADLVLWFPDDICLYTPLAPKEHYIVLMVPLNLTELTLNPDPWTLCPNTLPCDHHDYGTWQKLIKWWHCIIMMKSLWMKWWANQMLIISSLLCLVSTECCWRTVTWRRSEHCAAHCRGNRRGKHVYIEGRIWRLSSAHKSHYIQGGLINFWLFHCFMNIWAQCLVSKLHLIK